MTFTHALSTNNYGTAKFIVSANAYEGTHTTIAAALTSASSGDTIFIRPGTYTENLTLKVGVNLTAFSGDGDTPNVTIIGKATLSTAGTVTISNIRLQTNSDFAIVVSGSVASILNLNNCYLNCSNNTGISYTSSSASSQINIKNCNGNLDTTGISTFSNSSSGTMEIYSSIFKNTGSSTTASTCSSGNLKIFYSVINEPLSFSSTASVLIDGCDIRTSTTNTTSITTSGTSLTSLINSSVKSGTASAISIGAGSALGPQMCVIDSNNTNAITGAGNCSNYSNLSFIGTSSLINTTTQGGGVGQGIISGTAPTGGFIGEQIRSFLPGASAVTLSNATAANVTNISLSAGIWDVTGLVTFSPTTMTATVLIGCVNTVSATLGTGGDNYVETTANTNGSGGVTVSIPTYRLTLASTTTVYLIAQVNFTAGTAKAYGRIVATRVG